MTWGAALQELVFEPRRAVMRWRAMGLSEATLWQMLALVLCLGALVLAFSLWVWPPPPDASLPPFLNNAFVWFLMEVIAQLALILILTPILRTGSADLTRRDVLLAVTLAQGAASLLLVPQALIAIVLPSASRLLGLTGAALLIGLLAIYLSELTGKPAALILLNLFLAFVVLVFITAFALALAGVDLGMHAVQP